jgi:hypothetical protein
MNYDGMGVEELKRQLTYLTSLRNNETPNTPLRRRLDDHVKEVEMRLAYERKQPAYRVQLLKQLLDTLEELQASTDMSDDLPANLMLTLIKAAEAYTRYHV